MIVERITFQAKYGHSDELVALLKDGPPGMGESSRGRLYTDLTGRMFTVAFEFEYPDMAAFAAGDTEQRQAFGTPEFEQWFAKMVAVTESGERQLFAVENIG